MKVRRYALAALPLVAALGVSTGSVANASTPGTVGSCKLVVPKAVRISQPLYQVPVSVTGGCALHPGPYATWYPNARKSATDQINFNGSKRATWDVYGDATKLGYRTWYGGGAWNVPYTYSYSQDNPLTDVRVGSWAGLWTSRSGEQITLNARAVRYATSLGRVIPWADQTGYVQYKPTGTNTWLYLRTVTTGSDGNARAIHYDDGTADYRVTFGGSSYIWDATSPTSHR
ncbi:MAG: hypothetical protein ABI360_01725 [Allobranchiibius sp.]